MRRGLVTLMYITHVHIFKQKKLNFLKHFNFSPGKSPLKRADTFSEGSRDHPTFCIRPTVEQQNGRFLCRQKQTSNMQKCRIRGAVYSQSLCCLWRGMLLESNSLSTRISHKMSILGNFTLCV